MRSTRTERGFRIFAKDIPCLFGGSVRVQEASVAFEGAHVWVFYDSIRCDLEAAPRIDVKSAKKLIRALQQFIREAEAGKLTEAAVARTK